MIKKNETLLKSNDEWLHFANPHQIISATSMNEVRNALREVEALVNSNNWHAAGFISYEAAPAFDPATRVLNTREFPLLWFGLYPEPRTLKTSEIFTQRPERKNIEKLMAPNWQADINRENYNSAIEKVKDYIAQGKTYQVNYTMRLNSDFNSDEWSFFLNLTRTQNKYAAYISTDHYTICSASPELFFKLNGENIFSQPMKGTAKRGRTTAEDTKQAEWLYNSTKNRAENVMIVDMIRNDLGRIAEVGSVRVPELFKIEKYPTLFQMTSTVQAKTDAPLDEIFSALFPCASITGAPKVSTMNIIAELEASPRNIYTGSIGYLSPNRKAQFNVAIRTALIDKKSNKAEYGIGSGIVWDSNAADEYDEALLKAQLLTETSQEFSLLETLLWTVEDGYFLLEEHTARIKDSAEYFNIPFSKAEVTNLLNKISNNFSSTQRIRILLDQAGNFTAEVKGLALKEKVFNIKLADVPINSFNKFYFHKTTKRDIYPSHNGYDDVLLFNEKNELTEFTIGNLVVEIDGKLVTPPISCGLLAGTFRSHLLRTGKIEERIVHLEELKKFKNIFLINSVRKWVKVSI